MRCRQLRISMWRHEAARVYDTIIIHVRALDAAGWGDMGFCHSPINSINGKMHDDLQTFKHSRTS